MNEPRSYSQRVEDLWTEVALARQVDSRRGWLDSPIVMWDYVQPLLTGQRRRNWMVDAAAQLGLARDGRWVSLGCGIGGTEIFGARNHLFGHLWGFDLSPGAVAAATRAAVDAEVAERLEFGVMDIEHPQLPAESFDVALFAMALHHVADLETCLAAVEQSLKPGGALLVNEYVGPARQQFGETQLEVVRELLALLPPRLRTLRDGHLKTEYSRRSIAEWIIADPSEAVRSPEIPSVVADQFDLVYRKDYGGTVLGPLLEDIIHNFEPDREEDVALVRSLGYIEQRLIRHGILTSDFAVMVAKKRA
ncbi:MAG TPA: class I SAM-dependent methyltransferase [Thermoanaerobaculia bacterium]|nr:class I SAM-dependent methyltransferase [Thermoanaerobaculia bacterium]